MPIDFNLWNDIEFFLYYDEFHYTIHEGLIQHLGAKIEFPL